ncbi:MOSC domain-containing protein [Paenibacillus sediminis]|uniref:MOSC domain-containing protein YiiM n=1 Tax=Paenibacillus sediminis TaxID=664909 RepID=A0ABS4H387_9BACL|nr:MOSC domain-containing protein [Paenibacillus sediminis]MBP1936991.1 MOSC domain-containing protein YiiM [Paenibacillus sediminis]
MSKSVKIMNLAVGLPKKVTYSEGKEMDSAICKEEIEEVFLTVDGFRGDGVADLKHHGGRDRAVCIYPYEHYALWEQEFDVKLPPATFGENLTVTNMLEEDVCIGDVYQCGDAVIQVTQARVPCSTITNRTGFPRLMKRMVQEGFTGYLCRVLQEGTVRKDSEITLLKRHPAQISVMYTNETYFRRPQDVDAMRKILEVEELAEEWRISLEKRLEK